MTLTDVRRQLLHFGFARTFADLAFRAVNRVVFLHLVKAVMLERVDPRLLEVDPDYRFGLLDQETLLRFTGSPDWELTEAFVRQSIARGDQCYGFLRGGELAAYCWYTRLPTEVGLPGVVLHFCHHFVHVYKGFTHPAHRGKRLHASGMTRALSLLLDRGARGLVTYVDLTSFAAVRSVTRAGYQSFGTSIIVRVFGRYLAWSSKGCDRCKFHFACGVDDATCCTEPASCRLENPGR
jgi:hypothetical protein